MGGGKGNGRKAGAAPFPTHCYDTMVVQVPQVSQWGAHLSLHLLSLSCPLGIATCLCNALKVPLLPLPTAPLPRNG